MLEFFNHYLFLPTLVVIILLVPLLSRTRRVWQTQRIPATYNLQPVELASAVAAHDQKASYVNEAMAALGFVPVTASEIRKPNSLVSFVLLRNPDDLSVANVTVGSNSKSSTTYIEFTQEFTDGTSLNVNSSPRVGVFPKEARKPVYRFPTMSVPELYAAFLKLRAGLSSGRSPVLSLSMEDPVADLCCKLDEQTARLVAKGYLHRSVDEGTHRLTFKGAFSFTFKLTSPWSEMINLAERASSHRALEAA